MLDCVAAWTVVVPLETIVNVGCASYVMTRRIAFASENVNESRSETAHVHDQWHFSTHEEDRLVFWGKRVIPGPEDAIAAYSDLERDVSK